MSQQPEFRRVLGMIDFTLLVIGSVIGADVYIMAALAAALLGPAQLVAWLIAGLLAALIIIAFIQCATIWPEVGGSYAYTHAAFGPLVGFVAGWTLYVGEWIALSVFPQAFVDYVEYFVPNVTFSERLLIEVALIGAVTLVNLPGVRFGGHLNDVLTLAKLVPLMILIVVGLAYAILRPTAAMGHLTPFAPLGWHGIGPAVLLIFWAYAGFELAVLPAAEVREPRRTLPRGLFLGMTIATLFYLLTSLSTVVSLPWDVIATSPRPLTDAFGAMLTALGLPARLGQIVMSLGGLVSIAGTYEVATLAVARLSYAMAADGLFPSAFCRLHPRFGTPYIGLIFQAISALMVVQFVGITDLINGSVFFLGLCYALTALAALRLLQRFPDRALHVPALRLLLVLGGLSGVYLTLQVSPTLMVIGTVTILAGLGVFGWRGRDRRKT